MILGRECGGLNREQIALENNGLTLISQPAIRYQTMFIHPSDKIASQPTKFQYTALCLPHIRFIEAKTASKDKRGTHKTPGSEGLLRSRTCSDPALQLFAFDCRFRASTTDDLRASEDL